MQFHARPPSFLVLIERGLFVHNELTGRNSPSTVGQDPGHLVMPPSVRKTADNSNSGAGIICSFRNRPAFFLPILKIEEIFSVFCCSKRISTTVEGPIRALRNPRDHK
jgi:hypothetical protein